MYEDITIDKPEALSRRTFLTGAGIAVAGGVIAATMTDTAHAAEAAQAEATITERVFDGQQLAIGHVVHEQDICSGCRTCEIVCTIAHEGVCGAALSRLKVSKNVMDACITDIYNCRQCAGAECVASCPTKALYIDPETGARVIDEEKCVGCKICMSACPVQGSMIKYNAEKNVCFKCDLCGGDPQCVKFCPMGALKASWVTYESADEGASLYELNLTGGALAWTHCETTTLELSETGSGLQLAGVVWTSHATQFNVVMCPYTVSADFYDAAGTKLGTSDTANGQIPEMSSFEFVLTTKDVSSINKVGKIVLNIHGDVITNSPNEEA